MRSIYSDGYVTLRPIKVLRSTSYYDQQGPLDGPLFGIFPKRIGCINPDFCSERYFESFFSCKSLSLHFSRILSCQNTFEPYVTNSTQFCQISREDSYFANSPFFHDFHKISEILVILIQRFPHSHKF